jgi:hypothetical protein
MHTRTMRRLFILTVLILCTLAPTASAADYARYVSSSADRLSLSNGHGAARLVSSDGVVFGNLGRGRITITDLARDAGVTTVDVWGWERIRYPRPGSVMYINLSRRMGFSIVDGRWRAVVRGRAVNASAAMVGDATLSEGRAGTYQVNYGARHRWPWAPKNVLS